MTDCSINYARDQGVGSACKIVPGTEIKWHFLLSFYVGITKSLQERHLMIDSKTSHVVNRTCIGWLSSDDLLKEQSHYLFQKVRVIKFHFVLRCHSPQKRCLLCWSLEMGLVFFPSYFKDYKGQWVTTQCLQIQQGFSLFSDKITGFMKTGILG